MDRTGISGEISRHRRRFFGTAALATIGALAVVSVSAESGDDLKPPAGYRQWFHVNTMIVDKASPLFKDLGGMHNVHVNAVGEPALRTAGPYPDGTIFLTDLHDFSVVDGAYVEGPLKGLAVIKKDSKQYAATVGLSILGGRRSHETIRDGCDQTILRMSSGKEGSRLRLFHLHFMTRSAPGRSGAFPYRGRESFGDGRKMSESNGTRMLCVPAFHRTWQRIETRRPTHG
jgi:hypothetical protein